MTSAEDRILAKAEALCGNFNIASLWMRTPIVDFDNKTPLQIISEGQEHELERYIESLESGYVG